MNLYDVVRRPVITEKAEVMRAANVYAFEVDDRANKTLVAKAMKEIYGVVPVKVNILNRPGKSKRNKYGVGFRPGMKKAYVYLKKTDKIQIFEGV